LIYLTAADPGHWFAGRELWSGAEGGCPHFCAEMIEAMGSSLRLNQIQPSRDDLRSLVENGRQATENDQAAKIVFPAAARTELRVIPSVHTEANAHCCRLERPF
jgi:hypothetical protein